MTGILEVEVFREGGRRVGASGRAPSPERLFASSARSRCSASGSSVEASFVTQAAQNGLPEYRIA
jgi:hypothetical protein